MRVAALPQGLRLPLRSRLTSRRGVACARAVQSDTQAQVQDAEQDVLRAVQAVTGRGKDGMSPEQQVLLDQAVQRLESEQGISEPTTNELLDGRWKLLYTSRPGTASPIQRTFTGVEAFTIFQEVYLNGGKMCRVNNVVEFGEDAKIGKLKVEAEASTDSRPLPGFTPRAGPGLALFGKSNTDPPVRPNMRINFQFDQAAFDIKSLPFKIPYPVPFKLLGDETKGWIDVTYMNREGNFRLTRGNKGTLFVLVKPEAKETTPVEALLAAVHAGADDDSVMRLALQLKGKGVADPARSELVQGKWRLIWSKQTQAANPLQKLLIGATKSWQIITRDSEGAAQLENLVDLGVAKVSAMAACEAQSGTKTGVRITTATIKFVGQNIDLPGVVKTADPDGFLEWMYLDENVRISRGNKGGTFVHTREA